MIQFTLKRIFFIGLLSASALSVWAQVGPPPGPVGPPPGAMGPPPPVAPPPPINPPCGDPNNPFSPPCPIPIDGGITILLAAGLAYGGKKALDLRKRA